MHKLLWRYFHIPSHNNPTTFWEAKQNYLHVGASCKPTMLGLKVCIKSKKSFTQEKDNYIPL